MNADLPPVGMNADLLGKTGNDRGDCLVDDALARGDAASWNQPTCNGTAPLQLAAGGIDEVDEQGALGVLIDVDVTTKRQRVTTTPATRVGPAEVVVARKLTSNCACSGSTIW